MAFNLVFVFLVGSGSLALWQFLLFVREGRNSALPSLTSGISKGLRQPSRGAVYM